mgnify:CR=1 FL=1
MPIAESSQAASLTFDAAVYRALARRPADTPHPPRPADAPTAEAAPSAPLPAEAAAAG